MQSYLLATRAVDPATGELATWMLPQMYTATSAGAVSAICQIEGLGFASVYGVFLGDHDLETGETKEHTPPNEVILNLN